MITRTVLIVLFAVRRPNLTAVYTLPAVQKERGGGIVRDGFQVRLRKYERKRKDL